jgi:hypothetical protein
MAEKSDEEKRIAAALLGSSGGTARAKRLSQSAASRSPKLQLRLDGRRRRLKRKTESERRFEEKHRSGTARIASSPR